jgi:hypothetical protein
LEATCQEFEMQLVAVEKPRLGVETAGTRDQCHQRFDEATSWAVFLRTSGVKADSGVLEAWQKAMDLLGSPATFYTMSC